MENYYNYIFNPVRLKSIKKLDWKDLWIKKLDYLEKFYLKIKGKYKIIDESINYYIIMTEMAIYYSKDYDNYYDYGYIQHKIIIKNMFFDKKYLKDDIKERDFAEYLKYIFFINKYSINEVYLLIEKNVNRFNYNLVILRLLFPNYYFFYMESYILENNCTIFQIVSRSKEYEEYIKCIVDKINEFEIKKIILPF